MGALGAFIEVVVKSILIEEYFMTKFKFELLEKIWTISKQCSSAACKCFSEKAFCVFEYDSCETTSHLNSATNILALAISILNFSFEDIRSIS